MKKMKKRMTKGNLTPKKGERFPFFIGKIVKHFTHFPFSLLLSFVTKLENLYINY